MVKRYESFVPGGDQRVKGSYSNRLRAIAKVTQGASSGLFRDYCFYLFYRGVLVLTWSLISVWSRHGMGGGLYRFGAFVNWGTRECESVLFSSGPGQLRA